MDQIKQQVIKRIILLHEEELRKFLIKYLPALSVIYIRDDIGSRIQQDWVDSFILQIMGPFIRRLSNEAEEYYTTYEIYGLPLWDGADNITLMREVVSYFMEEYVDELDESEENDAEMYKSDDGLNTSDGKFIFYISLIISLMDSYDKGQKEKKELENNTILKQEIITETIEEIEGELDEIKTKLSDIWKIIGAMN